MRCCHALELSGEHLLMISNVSNAQECYVWVWLPKQTQPVVAGHLAFSHQQVAFTYGRSYLRNPEAIPLSPVGLPLRAGTTYPSGMKVLPSCLRDAGPDAWGRRVIDYRYPQLNANEIDYLLLSSSNRIGALDFQASAQIYSPRLATSLHLKHIDYFAGLAEEQATIDQHLALLFLHGTSIGGARPKCMIVHQDRECIAKFSLSTDFYPIIKTEYIAMKLAQYVGLSVAEVAMVKQGKRDVLLVKRFDRTSQSKKENRRLMLSALSLLDLDEMEARYASYLDLADCVRKHFVDPIATLTELFSRLVFNVLIGNTDDHARNHAAFWEGEYCELTPAYDLCPQMRIGQEATQAMAIGGAQGNLSTVHNVLSVAQHFSLSSSQAREIVDHQIATINKYWQPLCDEKGSA